MQSGVDYLIVCMETENEGLVKDAYASIGSRCIWNVLSLTELVRILKCGLEVCGKFPPAKSIFPVDWFRECPLLTDVGGGGRSGLKTAAGSTPFGTKDDVRVGGAGGDAAPLNMKKNSTW